MGSHSIGSWLIVAGFAILVGPFVVLFLRAIGPTGWMILGFLLIGVGSLITLFEKTRSDGSGHRTWTNCDNCGKRIDDRAPTCAYCGTDR